MNKRQRPVAQALVRANDFAGTLLPDFTHQPPTKVDLKFASARERITASIDLLGGKQAIQAGGAYHEESDHQGVLRHDLEEELRDINSTATSIAEETENPSMMARFRMPHAESDSDLAASARAIAAAIRELSLNDEFEAHGHPEDTATDLEEMVAEFVGSEGDQGTALGNQAGATAVIPQVLRKGRSAMKTLNAIFRRVYKGNIEVLTAWKTASHIQRVAVTPRPKKKPEDNS